MRVLVALALAGCAVDLAEVEQHVQQRVLLPVGGTGQHAVVITGIYHPLDVVLYDTNGDPVVGASITFTAPASGPSATFESGGVTETDGEGRAELRPYGNEWAGSYQVWAHADGAAPMPFLLTNHAGAPAVVTAVRGSGQSAGFGQAFAEPLTVDVHDLYGNPVRDIAVEFVAPLEGPTARMVDQGLLTTDASGRASITATAGALPGSYTIMARVAGTGDERFVLANVAGLWRHKLEVATPVSVAAGLIH